MLIKTAPKIVFLLIVNVIILILASASVLANGAVEKPPEEFDDIMELEFIKEVQNPKTKEFEYTLRLRSLLNTNRVRVTWELANNLARGIEDQPLSDAVTVEKGTDLYIRKRFIPQTDGLEKIRARVTVYETEGEYFSYLDKEFVIRENTYEIDPNNSDYKTAKSILSTAEISKKVLMGVITFLIILNIAYRFRRWIVSD